MEASEPTFGWYNYRVLHGNDIDWNNSHLLYLSLNLVSYVVHDSHEVVFHVFGNKRSYLCHPGKMKNT